MGILFLIYGVVIGSFLNVVIYRVPAGISIVAPPSRCGTCETRLKAKDLVPVISYAFLKGKCAYCGEKISFRYPLIELINGLLYVLIYVRFGFTMEAILLALLSSTFLVIAMIDFDTMDVYMSIVLMGGILGFVLLMSRLYQGEQIMPYIISAGGGMLFIYLVIFLTKGGMGQGDIWILGLIGLILGPTLTLFSFFSTSIIGGAYATFFLMIKKKNRKEGIPFGPFLVLGFFIALFVGNESIRVYLDLIN